MDDRAWEAAATLVDKAYVDQARQVAASNGAAQRILLETRKLPENGWREDQIESFLAHCAAMDSNNFANNVGVGEREARVVSRLVARRHMGFAHGVGRSGDIAAVQPKAAGSSLLAKLTNLLALDALREAGMTEMKSALVLPCATGLSLAICLLALRGSCEAGVPLEVDAKRVVIWMRIDQKSCFKAISLAGLKPEVIEPTRSKSRGSAPKDHQKSKKERQAAALIPAVREAEDLGDELLSDIGALEARIAELGVDKVLCVVTTTSCFAPRAPDDVESVARVCKRVGILHLVNNAYGVQCAATCSRISRAMRVGKVDLVVQSTDKNFLVPVGGAVVSSGDAKMVETVGKMYPGRASATPSLDLFITLLEIGRSGWRRLLDEREALRATFEVELRQVAEKHGERLLDCRHNRISFGLSLEHMANKASDQPEAVAEVVTRFGSMLFTRCVSGTRVCAPGSTKTISGVVFEGFGTSCSDYPFPYLTVACSIGVKAEELAEFIKRLDKTFLQFHKQLEKKKKQQASLKQNTSALKEG